VGDVTVRASSVDVRSVGAGGGSIAQFRNSPRPLCVGPQSAGADPGPAAYARGGDEPTVTNANVVLGYLPEVARLGGEMRLDRNLAERAVTKVARVFAQTRGRRHHRHCERKDAWAAASARRGPGRDAYVPNLRRAQPSRHYAAESTELRRSERPRRRPSIDRSPRCPAE